MYRGPMAPVGVMMISAGVALGAPPSFTGVGDLPGGSTASFVNALSADGSVAVGRSGSANATNPSGCCEAFRWTQAGGMVPLGDLPLGAFESEAMDIAHDGTAIVGQAHIGVDIGFRWMQATGLIQLPELQGGGLGGVIVGACSADGSIIVGSDQGPNGRGAFILTTGHAFALPMGDLPGGIFRSEALAVSDSGWVAAGSSTSGSGTEAFRWSNETGMQPLGSLGGSPFESVANGISGDGAVIVGRARSPLGTEAFRWTLASGMVALGDLPGGITSSEAWDANADGSIIVGTGAGAGGQRAFIWDPVHGVRDLRDVLVGELGLNLSGWTLTSARAVTPDGRTIAGHGVNPGGATEGWVAHLGSACYPDCDGSGALDVGDYICFQTRFALGDPYADCDGNGVRNVSDYVCFQTHFAVGCR